MKKKSYILILSLIFMLFIITINTKETMFNYEIKGISLNEENEDLTKEKVIDFFGGMAQNDSGVIFLETKSGYVYSNANPLSYSKVNSVALAGSYKKVRKDDGTALRDVKKISVGATFEASKRFAIILTDAGELYAWGENLYGQFGNGTVISSDTATQLNPQYNSQNISDIVDICAGAKNIYLLTANGDVYAAGDNTYGQLGIGTQGEASNVFVKSDITNVKQIMSQGNATIALKADGSVMLWGYQNTYSNYAISGTPQTVSEVTNIKMLSQPSGEYGTAYPYFACIDENNKIYYNFTQKKSYLSGAGSKLVVDGNAILKDKTIAFMSNGYTHSEQTPMTILTTDGNVYAIALYATPTLKPLSQYASALPDIDIKKALSYDANVSYTAVLKNTGEFIVNGSTVVKPSFAIDGEKKSTGTNYSDKEKYNDTIILKTMIVNSAITSASIKQKDLLVPNAQYENSMILGNPGQITIEIAEGEQIKREYNIYDTSDENLYSTYIVDLYKHAINTNDVSVTEGGAYPVNKKLTWDQYNGLTAGENSVKAILTKDGVDQEITYDHAVSEAGSYTLKLTDEYGNTASYSFTVSLNPTPTGVTFAPSGTLKYKNEFTSAGNALGTLSLTYNVGDAISTIASTEITDGNDNGYFSVYVDAASSKTTLKAEKNVPSGTYHLKLKGKDANGMEFKDLTVELVIAKADNPITWHEDSAALKNDGIAFGNSVTLKTKGTPAGETIKVEYTLKSPSEYVSVNKETGAVTISSMPESGSLSVIFVATPSGNSNYNLAAIELPVSIKRQSIKLKTVIEDQGTSKDTFTINVGDPLPVFKVAAKETLPDGITMDDLGTPAKYVYENGFSTLVEHPNAKAGTYKVKADYGNAIHQYAVEWTYATLIVEDIEISDSNAYGFYELKTTNDAGDEITYTPGNWTNNDVKIIAKHTYFDHVSIGKNPITQNATYSTEGDTTLNLTFHHKTLIDAKAEVSIPHIKIDKTRPTLNSIQYTDKQENAFMSLLSTLTFNLITSKAQTATFTGTDTNGSGIKEYVYILSEIDEDGTVTHAGSEETGDHVDLAKNTMYKLEVQAVDNAGNRSEKKTEYIKIDDQAGILTVDALINGETDKKYTGEWTSEKIDISLSYDKPIKEYKVKINDGLETVLPNGTITINNNQAIDGDIYLFKAISDTGVETTRSIEVKIDPVQPQFTISAQTEDGNYISGKESEKDITIIPRQSQKNLSGVSYYYTTDENVSKTNPTEAGWTVYSAPIIVNTNGTKTYYFKSVSGAGKVSDLQSITTTISKKEYSDIQVYVTSEGEAYSSGTWAKEDVTFKLSKGISDETQIAGYEYAITDGTRPDANVIWYSVQNKQLELRQSIQNKTYWFRVLPVDPAGKTSEGIKVNLDTDLPNVPVLDMEVINDNAIAQLINTLSFGSWMNKKISVGMRSEDQTSGIDHYEYMEGSEVKRSSKRTILFEEDVKTTIKARACDIAGNCSAYSNEKSVMIDQKAPEVMGAENGKTYYLPYVTYKDTGSGIEIAKTVFNDGSGVKAFTNGTLFRGNATIKLHVEDQAENSIEVNFTVKKIPKVEDLTEEDRDIVDQIEDEYGKVKDQLNEEQKKEIEDWLEKAKEKLKIFIKEVEDPKTTVKVEGVGETQFEEDTKLVVEVVTEQIDMTEIRLDKVEGLDEQTEVKAAYDIYLELNGTKVQPQGTVKVKIPYTEEMKTWEDIRIVYIADDKSITVYSHEIEKTEEKKYVVFETTHFSQYAVVGKAKETIDKSEVNIDTDGDGLPDVNLDFNDDGIAELNIDNDTKNNKNDKRVPDIDIDTDGDGIRDVNIDRNGDGEAEENIKEITEWTPEKNCEYKEMKYDTMSNAGEPKKAGGSNQNQGTNPINTPMTVSQAQVSKAKTGGVSTGDHTTLMMYAGILCSSLSIIAYVIFIKNKRKQN